MEHNNKYNFCYDGTIEGFLCIMDFCIKNRTIPLHIKPEHMLNGYECDSYVRITSDIRRAEYVYKAIGRHGSAQVQQIVLDAFLTASVNKEMNLFVFICKAFKYGSVIAEDYSDRINADIQFAIRDLYREAQMIISNLGIVCKENTGIAIINPRNNVVPIIKDNIFARSETENIILYDKRHNIAAVRFMDRSTVLDLTYVLHEEIKGADDIVNKLIPYLRSSGIISHRNTNTRINELDPFWYTAG